jgi:hypothetical protein
MAKRTKATTAQSVADNSSDAPCDDDVVTFVDTDYPDRPVPTVAALRASIREYQSWWIEAIREGHGKLYTLLAHGVIIEWWNAARMIDGAPHTVPSMPAPFPKQANDLQQALEAADLMLTWCDEADAAMKAPADKSEQREANGGSIAAEEGDDSAFVPAGTLWQQHFTQYKQFKTWLDRTSESEIHRRNPSKNRLVIHAGDWAKYWAAQEKKGFASLDGTAPPEITKMVTDGVRERYNNLHAEKQRQQPQGSAPLDALVKRVQAGK